MGLTLWAPRGARFACPEPDCTQAECAVHDTVEKTWRHLDFFQHQAYLSARVPRVRCPEHGVHLVTVPWAKPGSGFTLLFEVAMLTYAKQMPIAPLAKMACEHDTRIWRVIEHHVETARAGMQTRWRRSRLISPRMAVTRRPTLADAESYLRRWCYGAKRRARDYRAKSKMITIIYLIAGKLPLPQIHTI